MDALREQYEGGVKMSAYKDKTQGTWYVSFRYIDWTGKKTQKLKRGFKTKKEALNFEKEFIRKTAADMKMEMNSFIQVYFEDKKTSKIVVFYPDGKEKVIMNSVDVEAKQNLNYMMKEFKKIAKDKAATQFIKLALESLGNDAALKKLDNLVEGMKLARGID